jgi:RNA polymerase sigma factor (TIGR02999 family)
VDAPTNEPLAVLVARAEAGDAPARDALFSALYDELHRLAQSHVRRGGNNLTLGATTLLHEAYLDIARRDALAFPDRHRFLGYASRAMRGLVIDYVRQRHARKRGGDLTFTTLDEGRVESAAQGPDIDALGAALDELAALDPALAQLVDLKVFCGFTFAEVAGLRGVAERTVQRDWAKARVLLHRFLGGEGG